MYASCRCSTGCSFDAKIVKLGWYIRGWFKYDPEFFFFFKFISILKIQN